MMRIIRPVFVLLVLALDVSVGFAHQNFCAGGGCLTVAKDGEILFANQYIGQDLWSTGGRHDRQLLKCRVDGQTMYVTVDEEGKRLYLVKEPERGSYWRFVVCTRNKVVTTIRTDEALKGGPFYIAIDGEKPMKRKGPRPETNKGKIEHTVYPAIITNRADEKGTRFSSHLIAP